MGNDLVGDFLASYDILIVGDHKLSSINLRQRIKIGIDTTLNCWLIRLNLDFGKRSRILSDWQGPFQHSTFRSNLHTKVNDLGWLGGNLDSRDIKFVRVYLIHTAHSGLSKGSDSEAILSAHGKCCSSVR